MKKTIGIVMILLMLMSVTVALAGNAKDTQTGGEKVKVIIGFVDTPDTGDENMIRGHGGKTKYTYHTINAKAVEIPEQAIDRIKKNPRVNYVEADAKVYALEDTLPWGVDRIDAELVWNGTDGGCDVTTGRNAGDGVKVAIIDTGIDYNHPDLSGNYVGGIGYREGVVIDPMDDHGHGTHCAGIVAAADNGGGVIGVAPEVDLYAVKALNQYYNGYYGYNSDIVAGIEWSITNGMQIISMSLGSNSPSEAIEDACDKAYGSGIVVVAAAGNDYSSRGRAEFDTVDYPARYDSVIAVGATDSYDERAYFSSTGPDVELAAPGVSIYSTIIGGYTYMSGTSMACPHVAGTAALVMAAYPDWTNVQVRQQLRDTADDLGAAGFDYWYGYGLVDADEAAPQPSDATPVVNIVNPAGESTVSGTITIEADASDDVGITKVDFYIDDEWLATDTESPYSCSWDTTNVSDGSYIIKATATDTAEQTASDSIGVTVDNTANFMYVDSIEMVLAVRGINYYATATVKIVDANDNPVVWATVGGHWEDATSDDDTGTTDVEGRVTLLSDKVKRPSSGTTFTFTVDGVAKEGWSYDSDATNNSITIP